MSRVYLIRHGRAAAAWGGADADPGLDADGLEQARGAAAELHELPAGVRPVRAASSPLRRCQETAQPFLAALPPAAALELDPRVAEVPTPLGLAESERGPWLRSAFQGRWRDIPGDLDYLAWRDGVAAAVAARPGYAIFTHFVAINAAVSAATGSEEVRAFEPDHASITVFEAVGGRLELVALGRSAPTRVL